MNVDKPKILIVDDEIRSANLLKINLQEKYDVIITDSPLQGIEVVKTYPIDLVITDIRMPKMDGNEFILELKKLNPALPVIVVTAYGSIENAIKSIKQGAYDYIQKPIDLEVLDKSIVKALELKNILQENLQLKKKLQQYERGSGIITVNPQMKQLIGTIRQVAPAKVTVLLQGESGVGKEVFARTLHKLSNRADKPFVSVNCGAIPAELIESELFGHEKGAFTGAIAQKKGKFELADGGTLFLDEIGELPKPMQVKLLRAIELQEFTRVGGTKIIKTDIRFIAATNRDLEAEIEKGNFREDLYYRLKVVQIRIPPLRERKEDIPLLVHHFLEKHSDDVGKKVSKISPDVIEVLQQYDWPGNVRELENLIIHSMLFAKNDILTVDSLPAEFLNKLQKKKLNLNTVPTTKEELQALKKQFYEKIDRDLEYSFLINILMETKGSVAKAAEITHYNRRQLYNLIQKYDIDLKKFR